MGILRRVAIGTGLGAVASLPALALAVMSAGSGHGHYVAARILFPYSMLLTRVSGGSIAFPLIILAFVQFPLYGALVAVCGRPRPAFAVAAFIGIAIAHAVAAFYCFCGLLPNFS